MPTLSYPKSKKITAIIFFILCLAAYVYAAGEDTFGLSKFQKEAREYRNQGMQAQNIHDLDTAMSFYQKAISLDPYYAVAYNDLGVVFEAKGMLNEAEMAYLKAIDVDPNYLSAYSNLALLYEENYNLERALQYWEKRVQLGLPDDPWTQEARRHLEDLSLLLGRPSRLEVIELSKEIMAQRAIPLQSYSEMAQTHFERAKEYYRKGDDMDAFKEAYNAHQTDPANKEIKEFVDKVQKKLLSR